MNLPTIIAFAIAIIVIAAFAHARRRSNGAPPQPSSGWHIQYSVGMPATPVAVPGGGFYFDFPPAGGHVDYVQNFTPPALTYGKKLTMNFDVTGGGFVAEQAPSEPAAVTLMLERRGDPGTAVGAYANYRQYSTKFGLLAAGHFTLSVTLDETNFGGVFGAHDEAAFRACLADLASVGPVFGSASLRGHGVYANKPSRFTLRSMTVTD